MQLWVPPIFAGIQNAGAAVAFIDGVTGRPGRASATRSTSRRRPLRPESGPRYGSTSAGYKQSIPATAWT